jgi:4-hydroxy-tetrahydrodipicolinate reductase
MGKALCDIISKDNSLELIGGIRKTNTTQTDIGIDISSLMKKSDIVIDFSSPDSLQDILKSAQKYNKPIVIGTTGYSKEQLHQIKLASKNTPILLSSNFSLGIAICKMISSLAFNKANKKFDIKIEETHHINKKDSPSGTAIMLQEQLSKDIPIISKREKDVIGEHKIIFSSKEEMFEIKHTAFSRDVFAKGAILCTKYLYGKKPNLYSIDDIFI